MLKQLFARAADTGLLWLGQPSEAHRRLFSDAKVALTAVPSSYEAICTIAVAHSEGKPLPAVFVDSEIARRDRDCLVQTLRKVEGFDDVYLVLFGQQRKDDIAKLYNQIIASNSELLSGSDTVLVKSKQVLGKAIPEGIKQSGRVLLLENNSTRRLIAQGLLRSLAIEHEIMDDIPNQWNGDQFGVVLLSHEMLDLPGAVQILQSPVRKVLMGGVPREGLETISVPLREKDLVKLLRGSSTVTDISPKTSAPTVAQAAPKSFEVNIEEIVARLGVSEDIVTLVLNTYLTDLDKQLRQLSDAIDSRDPKDVKSAAHLIKGAGSTVGAHELSSFASALEKQALAEFELATISAVTVTNAEQLFDALQDIKQHLKEYFSKEAANG